MLHFAVYRSYCKTLDIRGVKFSRINENDILAHFNFGVHDIIWLKIVKKIWCKSVTFYLTIRCVIY